MTMSTASRILRRISPRRAGVTAAASGALALTAALTAGAALAGPAGASTLASSGYRFRTVNNTHDVTFNQLLGVNNAGVIAGYFGSGAQNHPNKGYLLLHHGSYLDENFPGSVQTQVTGLNDRGVTVGFWSSMNNANQVNDNQGFYAAGGRFHTVDFPTGDNASPIVDQLLGVNNHDVAVGFYVNGQGSSRGYTYDIRTRHFTRVLVPGAPAGQAGPSLTAAGINNHGDVTGFYAKSSSQTDAFLRLSWGRFITLAVPGASMTQALGVNDSDEVVGVYTVGSGDNAQAHGFTWRPGYGFRTVDDPHGIGATTINGVNDAGVLVGFYTDAAGNTDGMIAQPR
jgi:hypothetical protein